MIHPDLIHCREILKLLLEELKDNKEYDYIWYCRELTKIRNKLL